MVNLHWKTLGCPTKAEGQQQTQQMELQGQVVSKESPGAKHKQTQKNLIKPANEPGHECSVETELLNKSDHQDMIVKLIVKQERN